MAIHPSDLTFLEVLAIVTSQGSMLMGALTLAAQGSNAALAGFLLGGVIALGLVLVLWERLPWLHPWDRAARAAGNEA